MKRSLVSIAALLTLFAASLTPLRPSLHIMAQHSHPTAPEASEGSPTDGITIPPGELTPVERYPGEVLPGIEPIPLPPVESAFTPIISDDQYLSGFSLDTSVIQARLREIGSVLGEAELIFEDGTPLPAAEAISSWSGLYTISPAVLMTVAEMQHGLLSRSAAEPLTEAEIATYSAWFPQIAGQMATRFYEIYNSEAEQISLNGPQALSGRGYINAGSYATMFILNTADTTQGIEPGQETFVGIFSRYFGSPTDGHLYVEHPDVALLDGILPLLQAAPVTDPEADAPVLQPSPVASPEADAPVLQPLPVASPEAAPDLVSPTSSSSTPLFTYKFPWTGNDQWNYNSGPHPWNGAGSTYHSLDFQPGNMNGCNPLVATDRYVIASASGRVIQSAYPIVTIDHDMDGKRSTGLQTQYYHMANNTAYVSANKLVKQGAKLGNPSCNDAPGGLHVHFSFLANGAYQSIGGRILSGWTVRNGSQSYHGYLDRTGYPTRQSGFRPGGNQYDAADTVLISDNCGLDQYLVEYFNGRLPSNVYPATYRRCVSSISHDWGSGGPGNGIGNDNFSARWIGTLPLLAGRYTFYARADDGVRLWVGGAALVNYWNDQGPTTRSGVGVVSSSGEFVLEMEYYENGGGAVAQMWYSRDHWATSHTIRPLHSGKCLDVYYASIDNGATIQQYYCNGTGAQSFKLIKRTGSYFEIRNTNSNKCMDVYGYATNDGAGVVQWDCHGGNNQLWQLEHMGRGYYRLISRHSGKCLAVPDGSTADWVQLRQYSCTSDNHQLWKVR